MSTLSMDPQSKIMGGGYSPWQAPLAALFAGISAAGQPGGWANFGMGASQGAAQFQQGQQQRQLMELRQQQLEQAQQEMRTREEERAAEEARKKSLVDFLSGGGIQPVRQIGDVPGRAVGGAQGQGPSLTQWFTPEQVPLFQQYAQTDPEGAAQLLMDRAFAGPKGRETIEIAGQLIDKQTGEVIRDFTQQELALRRASAANQSVEYNVGPTGIDYGDPEKGLVWARNPDQSIKLDERGAPIAIPYQGGPAFIDEEARKKAEAARTTAKAISGDIVTDEISRALELRKEAILPTEGWIGGGLSKVPSTAAYDLSKLTDTIKANIGFDKLQSLREQSPTGGALGQVAVQELMYLQGAVGSLDQSQSPNQYEYNLKRVYNLYQDIVHGEGNGPERFSLGKPSSNRKPESRTKDDASGGGDNIIRYDTQGNRIQ